MIIVINFYCYSDVFFSTNFCILHIESRTKRIYMIFASDDNIFFHCEHRFPLTNLKMAHFKDHLSKKEEKKSGSGHLKSYFSIQTTSMWMSFTRIYCR